MPDGTFRQMPADISQEASPFAQRSAFLLNANARKVSDRLVEQLAQVIPAGDLFLSRSLEDAEVFLRVIHERGYGKVFTGGGDGTLVSAINTLQTLCTKSGRTMPKVGVLKLGTGNAMATRMQAKSPVVDAHHMVASGDHETEEVFMVQCDDGTQAPFAGIGYDGEILNDYNQMKNSIKQPFLKYLMTTVFGYLTSILTRSAPRHLKSSNPTVVLTSSQDAFCIVSDKEGDHEVSIPAGTVLYEGPAPEVCVGSIPFFGYAFTMFPHAQRKRGYMQLRVVATSIPRLFANLFPGIWKGTYRHPELHDFLIKDVQVQGSRPLPYEVGGDAAGHRQNLSFSVSEEPVQMVRLADKRLKPAKNGLGQRGLLATES